MSTATDQDLTIARTRPVTEAALRRAASAGASFAAVRVRRTRSLRDRVRDTSPIGTSTETETGFGVRVLLDGTWGFAAGIELSPRAAEEAVDRALDLARAVRPLRGAPVELAAEPVRPEANWSSAYEIDPFDVPAAERMALLRHWCASLHDAGVGHAEAYLQAFRETSVHADSEGRRLRQTRVWMHPMITAFAVDEATGAVEAMRTLGPPAGRGWEYLSGTGWDWAGELAALPALLSGKLAAPGVTAGEYDLVVDPTNLWLTIHETVAHATELDRVLGHEAAFAGTSFVTANDAGRLRYGSAAMNVTADRTAAHGLATVGFDDEGVAAQQWPLIRDGVLVDYHSDRATAALTGRHRSTGCSYGVSFDGVPLTRLPNVSLEPAPLGPSTADLIARVRDGIYVVGDRSFSIDMQRMNFQFTGQRFFRIRDGELCGQLRDVAYTGATTEFWGSLEAVGGPQTYLLSGAGQCGKGQPLQLAGAGHGCPSALFRGVSVLNTSQGGAA